MFRFLKHETLFFLLLPSRVLSIYIHGHCSRPMFSFLSFIAEAFIFIRPQLSSSLIITNLTRVATPLKLPFPSMHHELVLGLHRWSIHCCLRSVLQASSTYPLLLCTMHHVHTTKPRCWSFCSSSSIHYSRDYLLTPLYDRYPIITSLIKVSFYAIQYLI